LDETEYLVTTLRLRNGGCSLVLAIDDSRVSILHWGADFTGGIPDVGDLAPARAISSHDVVVQCELLPSASAGWTGTPGLQGHRSGRDFSPRLRVTDVDESADATAVTIVCTDDDAGIAVTSRLELGVHGLLRMRHDLANTGQTPYQLDSLALSLPVPPRATELLDLTGRWARERQPQRTPFNFGRWARGERRGRTGHDSSVLFAAGTPGFASRTGEVWAVHLGWSSNHELAAERVPDGRALLSGAELFAPGELVLEPGSAYATPWLYAAYSADGLDGITAAFHGWLRARPEHPRTPRPVGINTWEAVYFDQDLETLAELAVAAAAVGVERFVVDDGWFLGRRTDQAGLGDWTVDPDVWPNGLTPLIDSVHELGMEFGLWVEPEMINTVSNAARAHPEWIAGPGPHDPILWRHQHVLDLTDDAAWRHVYSALDALLSKNAIDYLKWDHNRDLADMGHRGRGSAHSQMLAVYRLIDELRRAHPGVEIESCSSGGARVDLGILERTDRVWASDTNDALERQTIQRWTEVVLPPEIVGAHIGPPTSHTTGRTHSLWFRGITALFAHLGIEWDIRNLPESETRELSTLVSLYKEHRSMLHTGTLVRADLADPTRSLYGVVSPDGSEALLAYVALATSAAETPGFVRIPGLVAERDYSVTVISGEEADVYLEAAAPPWVSSGIAASGAFLGTVGLPFPILNPEKAILIRLVS
jgi:alpha-galactosidase